MDEGYGLPRFIWQEVTVSVSIDGIVTEQAVVGGAFTVPDAIADSRFLGWNTSFDGNGIPLTPGYSIPVSAGGFTIYALMKGDHPNYPIEISDAEELNAIRNKPNLHYRLTSDISLSAYNTGSGWTPIGTESIPFSGTLDGDGFKITDLYINSSERYVGLFGYLRGTVKNLGVEIAPGGVKGGSYTGAIAGYVDDGAITSSYSTGNVSGTSGVGGIAGSVNYGTITNCYSTGNINASSSNSYVGGIAGYVYGGMITDSYSTGSVSGSSIVGGITGYVVNGSTITNNVAANSTITGSGTSVSRVVGAIYGTNTVSNNFANSGMTGSAFNTTSANYGISKSLTVLQTQTTYSDTINGDGLGGLGWQFGNDDAHPWKMPSGGTGFPILYWQ
jgi:hypothetical protein